MHTARQAVRQFASVKTNLLAIGTLPVLGLWIYFRVSAVNPAILGDEFLYSMNARKTGVWEPPVAGDFSNYLFNFVYQGTNLCGDAFYSCTKILNIVFFLAFIFTMFLVAVRFLPFWISFAFMVAAALSPLNVYTSMFLPESMYFFAIGLVFVSVLRAIADFKWTNWMLVGIMLGLASLVKPHAWLSAIAIGVTFLVTGLGNKALGVRGVFLSGTAMVSGAILARVIVGMAIAGPQALGFFGQYLGFSTVERLFSDTEGPVDPSGATGQTPLGGMLDLFGSQLVVHSLTVVAIMGLSVIALVAGVLNLAATKSLNNANGLALFVFIWLVTMVVEIVMFTGWVTGSGDDHSTRVLLRYYEFLFVIAPLAGIIALKAKFAEELNTFVRWVLAILVVSALTPAFSGFFGSLTVQIADAPTLAGLIVNYDIFNLAAILAIVSVLVFASFPRWSVYALLLLLPVTMVGTGWQTQNQYQNFRGTSAPADIVGKLVARDFSEKKISATWVLGTSRFEVTNVAFWADNPDLEFEIFGAGSVIEASWAPAGTQAIVVLDGISLIGENFVPEFVGDGFAIYSSTD